MTQGTAASGLTGRVQVERAAFRLDVELTAPPGAVLALLGPNGSGKSTLLSAVAGLIPLSGGHLELDGVVLDDAGNRFVSPQRRRVGLMFQDYLLFPHLSVVDNVGFGPRSLGSSRAQSRETARQMLRRLRIEDLAQRKPGSLSGGQAQRVALARALACDPQLLLMDEPLAALDAGTRREVRSELRRHLSAIGVTTVMVTHDPVDAMVLADHLVVLEAGRVVQRGTPSEVARRPASDYVGALVGMTLLRGTATDGTVNLTGGAQLQIVDHTLSGPVLVAVRPESVGVHRDRPEGSPRNVWRGVIADLTDLHGRVRLDVLGPPDVAVDVTAAAVADLRLAVGAQVWLSLKATEPAVYADPA
jgi:molybdate transport system ATP-binding protein